MSDATQLSAIEFCIQESAKCIGCGTCLGTCPVYATEQREAVVARGRNQHMLTLVSPDRSASATEDIGKCLLCGRCTMVCLQNVRNDMIVSALREACVAHDGLPFAKKIAFQKLMKNRGLMGQAIRVACRLQRTLPQDPTVHIGTQEDEGPLLRHLPLFFNNMAKGRRFPSVAKKFLSERLPEHICSCSADGTKGRVAYFAGCATEFVTPNSGEAIVRVLTQAGMDVVFPHQQGCCGLAMHANGDVASAAEVARHNLDILEKLDVDYIVTGCATCGSAMRNIWPTLGRTPQETTRFTALAQKVCDASALVCSLANPTTFSCTSRLPRGSVVTWHEPCHLGRHQGVSREPLTILQRVFGQDYHPLQHSGCCGFGGSFNMYHYDISQQIGETKAQNIRETGAEYVITSCPGCLIQLTDLMAQHNIKGRVLHLMEAIQFTR